MHSVYHNLNGFSTTWREEEVLLTGHSWHYLRRSEAPQEGLPVRLPSRSWSGRKPSQYGRCCVGRGESAGSYPLSPICSLTPRSRITTNPSPAAPPCSSG